MGIGVHTDMATPALAQYGSDELKRNFLAPAIAGDGLFCLGTVPLRDINDESKNPKRMLLKFENNVNFHNRPLKLSSTMNFEHVLKS